MSIIGHRGIQVLSDINSVDDLPEIADVESEAVWYIESGDFAPDYIAPSFWDGEQFNEWISLFDGDVLDGIPDTAIARYLLAEEDNSNVTIVDELDNHNGTNQGTTSVEDNDYVEGRARQADGTDQYIELTTWGDFGSTLGSGFCLPLTLETTDTGYICRIDNSGSDQRGGWWTNEAFGSTSGHFTFGFADIDDNRAIVELDEDVTDGTRRRIYPNAVGNDPNNWEIWVATESNPDPTKQDVTVVENDTLQNVENFDEFAPLFARNNEGSISDYIAATLDDVIPCVDSLDESEIEADASRQPWL